jgi:hypothetical protein
MASLQFMREGHKPLGCRMGPHVAFHRYAVRLNRRISSLHEGLGATDDKGTALSDQTSKIRAEMRARQAEDGRKAMAEYHANAVAVRARMEKLRALRLAQEAAEAAEARNKPASVAKARTGTKAGAGTLEAKSRPLADKPKTVKKTRTPKAKARLLENHADAEHGA